MKSKILFISVALVLFIHSVSAQTPDFSGTWNFSRSDTNIVAPSQVTISRTQTSLRLIRNFPDGSHAVETYLFDSTPVDTLMSGYKKSSYLKWSKGEKQFVIISVYNMTPAGQAPWQYTRTEKYSVSTGPQVLTIDRISELPDRTETVHAVYNKS